MTGCAGGPAEEFGERYLNGTLPEMESARFEDHYLACGECHEVLEALRTIQDGLSRDPVPIPLAAPKGFSVMPVRVVVWGSLAAVLVVGAVIVGVTAYRARTADDSAASDSAASDRTANHAGGSAAVLAPAPATPRSSAPAVASPDEPAQVASLEKPALEKLADRRIPGYSTPELRGAETAEPGHTEFVAGMHLYAVGNCAAALPHLAQVPGKAADAVAAELFTGLCQYQQKDWKRAQAGFRKVIVAGDTPQLETAEYYLAQTMLALGDAAEARTYLAKTIALHGDYEDKAKAELQLMQKEVARR